MLSRGIGARNRVSGIRRWPEDLRLEGATREMGVAGRGGPGPLDTAAPRDYSGGMSEAPPEDSNAALAWMWGQYVWVPLTWRINRRWGLHSAIARAMKTWLEGHVVTGQTGARPEPRTNTPATPAPRSDDAPVSRRRERRSAPQWGEVSPDGIPQATRKSAETRAVQRPSAGHAACACPGQAIAGADRVLGRTL